MGYSHGRYEALKAMLMTRRQDVVNMTTARDEAESEDIKLALIQMKSETLAKFDEAIAQLEQGNYGNCTECGEEIRETRLKAIPFAEHCKPCEEAREAKIERERRRQWSNNRRLD